MTISAEKGHMNYYRLQKIHFLPEQKHAINVVDVQVRANVGYILASTSKESKIYKVKLDHRPQVMQYLTMAEQYNPRTLKVLYFKEEVHTFRTDSINTHKF